MIRNAGEGVAEAVADGVTTGTTMMMSTYVTMMLLEENIRGFRKGFNQVVLAAPVSQSRSSKQKEMQKMPKF